MIKLNKNTDQFVIVNECWGVTYFYCDDYAWHSKNLQDRSRVVVYQGKDIAEKSMSLHKMRGTPGNLFVMPITIYLQTMAN